MVRLLTTSIFVSLSFSVMAKDTAALLPFYQCLGQLRWHNDYHHLPLSKSVLELKAKLDSGTLAASEKKQFQNAVIYLKNARTLWNKTSPDNVELYLVSQSDASLIKIDKKTKLATREYSNYYFKRIIEDIHGIKLEDPKKELPPLYIRISIRQGLQEGQEQDSSFTAEIKSVSFDTKDFAEKGKLRIAKLSRQVKPTVRREISKALGALLESTTESFRSENRQFSAAMGAVVPTPKPVTDREIYFGALKQCQSILTSNDELEKNLYGVLSAEIEEFNRLQ